MTTLKEAKAELLRESERLRVEIHDVADQADRLLTLSAQIAPAGRLIVKPLTEIKAEPVDWLWQGYLPRGKLALLGGFAGDGKSTLVATLAATASRGLAWPDGTFPPGPLRTLFVLGEDGAGDTLKPRLALHGADMSQIFVLDAVHDEHGRERTLDLRVHLELLEQVLRDRGIDILVIDPLSGAMPGSDRNAEGDVRDRLAATAAMAARVGAAVVGIAHVGKAAALANRPEQRILGATAFSAVARTVWMVAPLDDDTMALGVSKLNLARKPNALRWSRHDDGSIKWGGVTDYTIDEILAAEGNGRSGALTGRIVRQLERAAPDADGWVSRTALVRGLGNVRAEALSAATEGMERAGLLESRRVDTGTKPKFELRLLVPEHLKNSNYPGSEAESANSSKVQALGESAKRVDLGVTDLVVETARTISRLSVDDLAAYRREVASAPAGDRHADHDRAALAFFDSAMAAWGEA